MLKIYIFKYWLIILKKRCFYLKAVKPCLKTVDTYLEAIRNHLVALCKNL